MNQTTTTTTTAAAEHGLKILRSLCRQLGPYDQPSIARLYKHNNNPIKSVDNNQNCVDCSVEDKTNQNIGHCFFGETIFSVSVVVVKDNRKFIDLFIDQNKKTNTRKTIFKM